MCLLSRAARRVQAPITRASGKCPSRLQARQIQLRAANTQTHHRVEFVSLTGNVTADVADPASVTQEMVERLPDGEPNIVRCPDPELAAEMVALIDKMREARDSIGGVAEIVATAETQRSRYDDPFSE